MAPEENIPVGEVHRLNTAALADYLSRALPGFFPIPPGVWFQERPGRKPFQGMVNGKASYADTIGAEGIMKIGRLRYGYYGWPLLLLSLFSAGCTEIFYYRTWRQPPPSSYVEPGPPKTVEEGRNPYYSIDCVNGVTCVSPDEEKTSQKDGLLIKECLWKNVPYKNGQPGLMWLTFSKKGDGCWQLHQEQNEAAGISSGKTPAK